MTKKQTPAYRATPAEVEVYAELLRTLNALQEPFAKLFKRHGISDAQYNVLRILRGAGDGGLPCQKIGERLIHRVPDITRLVDRLADAKLVSRQRIDEDRRVVLVHITTKGLDLLAQLDSPVFEMHVEQLSHLSKRDVLALRNLLTRARNQY